MKALGIIAKLSILAIIVFLCARFVMSDISDDFSYPLRYLDTVSEYSEKYSVQESLIFSIIKCESNFNSYAISKADAKGLMQICSETYEDAKEFLGLKDEDIFDKETNIHIGTWYLSYLIDRFGDERYAILAYNAGAENVVDWIQKGYLPQEKDYSSWNIPYPETQNYIDRVMKSKEIYEKRLKAGHEL